MLTCASNGKMLVGSTDEIADGLKKVGAGSKNVGTLGDAFTGLGTKIGGVLKALAINPMMWMSAIGAIGAYALLQAETFSSLSKNAQDSQSEYESTHNELASLTSELKTASNRIDELQSKGTLTLTEESELNKLKSQSAELERQIDLTQKLSDKKSDKSAEDAKKTLEKKGFLDITKDIDSNSSKRELGSAYEDSDIISATQNELKELKKLHDKRSELLNERKDTDTSRSRKKEIDKELKSVESEYEKFDSIISDNVSQLSDLQDNFINKTTGKVKSGYENYSNDIKDIITDYSNIDLSPTEQQLKSIDTFFDRSSSKGLTEYFTKLSESGKLTAKSFSEIGLSASDFGAKDLGQVAKYFNDITKYANEASDAVNNIDGSISGISAAMESGNAGDNFVKMKEYLDKSQELFAQGLTGTDDFQSIEKAITQGTGKSYQDAYAQLQKYFTTDQNKDSSYFGQLTRDGIQNFSNDFLNLGKTFKTTGEAAKEMKISTQMFEALMGRVSDYDGFEKAEQSFAGMIETSKQLSDARNNLDEIKSIYEKLDDGDPTKKQLKVDIDEWESQIENAENDLSSLPSEVVTELKFEYGRSQLKKMSEDAQNAAKDSGKKDVTLNANAITTERSYNKHLEDGINIDSLGKTTIPIYFDAEGAILNLEDQLHSGSLSKEQTLKVQAEIANLYDLQNSIMDTFYDTHPEITPGTAEATSAFALWAESVEGQEVIANMTANTDDAKERISEILGTDIEDISFNVDANGNASDTINSVYAELMGLPEEKVSELIAEDNASDAVISVMSAISGIPIETLTQVNASDGATGVLTTVLSGMLGIPQEKVSAILAKDGASGIANMAKVAINSVPSSKSSNLTASGNAQSQATAAKNAINSIPSSRSSVITITTIRETINKVSNIVSKFLGGGTGGVNGTAHVGGTAYTNGSIKRDIPADAFYNEKYRTDKGQKGVLVGELGAEMRVDPKTNTWELIGQNGAEFSNVPKGSIIFNHRQTKKLLENGYTNSRGTAKVTGTAFASGGIVENITNLNRPSAKKNKDSEDNSFSEIFDHIAIWLNRLDRTLENLKDSIGDYTEDLSKQNSIAQNVINQTRGSLSVLQNSYDTYIAQANAVGLENDWKNVVNSGEIRISEIKDEDLKQRIEDYQKYYEQALDVQDKIVGYQQDLLALAQEKLSNIENYYQNRRDYNEDFGYNTDINELKKALKEYQNELTNQMDSGVIKQGSESWYQAQKTIAEYLSNILEATWNKLEYVIDGLDRVSDKLDNVSSLEEAKGNKSTEKDYQAQISANNKSILSENNLRNSYKNQMAIYDIDSMQYQDLAKKISQCDDEIFKLRENNEALKDSIWDVRFTQPLDDLKNKYSDVIDEADKFRDLMDSASFVAKDGSLTSNGLANIAMIMQGMNASKQITADYTASLKKLDQALKNNIISQSEYDSQQKDILDTINDSVGVTEDYKNSLVDIYKEMAQAEVDSQNRMIDKRKEYINTQKDAYEYSKKIQGQSKNANQTRSKIAALQGVNNQSARAELKRLQAELAEQENEISESKKDREYTLRIDGLDSLSDSLSESLNETLDEITYNTEKQESIVKEMLGRVVGAYGTAYGQINSIIKDTGFKFGYDNNSNIGNIGNASGAQDQFNQSTTNQPNVKPSDKITDINTGSVNNTPNIDKIVDDISKPIDTTNRKVAELKLNKSSLSIQEGSFASLSVSIRPTDAKNKSVKWTSSNSAVATVSGGKVSANKPGSCQITASATDGSGLRSTASVVVNKKPEPPKPTPPPPSNNTGGGNGRPDVGDAVTFSKGSYYYDSQGVNPSGNDMLGETVYITKVNNLSWATKPYHISRTSALGERDLGWVTLDQIRGYYTGGQNVNGLVRFDDTPSGGSDFGSEMIATKHGVLAKLNDGTIFNKEQVQNLYEWSLSDDFKNVSNVPMLQMVLPNLPNTKADSSINININNMIGNIDSITKDSLPGLQDILKLAREDTTKYIKQELKKSGY